MSASLPLWALDLALDEHRKCCREYGLGRECGHAVYVQTLLRALGEAVIERNAAWRREWNAKGFPRQDR